MENDMTDIIDDALHDSTRLEYKAGVIELKGLTEDGTFEGYASTFGNVDSMGDIIDPKAFDKAIREAKKSGRYPKLLWQHDTREPIGVFTDMKKDDNGLMVKGRLTMAVARAKEAYALLKDGAMDSMSIGFAASKYEIDSKTGIRTLNEVKLYEISLVTFPANEMARVVGVKSELPRTEREFEQFLRDAGYSRKQALGITLSGFKAAHDKADSNLRDAGLEALNNTFSTLLKGLTQ